MEKKKRISENHFYLWFRIKPSFEALQLSWGWDFWFLTAPSSGAAVRQMLVLIMAQKWHWRGAGHDMAWGHHSIQVPQNLHSAASQENFLTHSSYFFFSYLLLVGFFFFIFPPLFFLFRGFFHSLVLLFSFFSLKWFGECDALCWQSICGLKNEERCFALAEGWVNCLKFLPGRHIQIPAGRWKHGW